MKKRIKIDSSILSALIIFTGFLFWFPGLYPKSTLTDDFLDALGIIIILIGVLIRMSARGHKKAFSKKSESLVTSGPYSLTRNPMYLGSFLLGAGFILIVWPWWTLLLFAGAFYLRFNKQMVKEEGFLNKKFPDEYKVYSKKVARIFPIFKNFKDLNLKKIFNFEEAFSTKESRGLVGWPILAVLLESFQEKIIFGDTDLIRTILIFVITGVVFLGFLKFLYFKKK